MVTEELFVVCFIHEQNKRTLKSEDELLWNVVLSVHSITRCTVIMSRMNNYMPNYVICQI